MIDHGRHDEGPRPTPAVLPLAAKPHLHVLEQLQQSICWRTAPNYQRRLQLRRRAVLRQQGPCRAQNPHNPTIGVLEAFRPSGRKLTLEFR